MEEVTEAEVDLVDQGDKEKALVEKKRSASISAVGNVASKLFTSVKSIPNVLRRSFNGSATGVSGEILLQVNSICEDPLFKESGLLPEGVRDIGWGLVETGSADRSNAKFFRLKVEESHMSGFVLRVNGSSKFKTVIFDTNGVCVHNAASVSARGSGHQCVFFRTSFPTHSMSEATPKAVGVPPVFSRLNSLEENQSDISVGFHLVAVIGDAMLGRTDFSLGAIPCPNVESGELVAADATLVSMKKSLDQQKEDYILKQEAFEAAQVNAKALSNDLDKLLATREKAYATFLEEASKPYDAMDTGPRNGFVAAASSAAASATAATSAVASSATAFATSSVATVGAGVGSAASSMGSVASSAAAKASANASAAASFMSNRLSGTFSILGLGGKGQKNNGTGAENEAESESVPADTEESRAPETVAPQVTEPSSAEAPAPSPATTESDTTETK